METEESSPICSSFSFSIQVCVVAASGVMSDTSLLFDAQLNIFGVALSSKAQHSCFAITCGIDSALKLFFSHNFLISSKSSMKSQGSYIFSSIFGKEPVDMLSPRLRKCLPLSNDDISSVDTNGSFLFGTSSTTIVSGMFCSVSLHSDESSAVTKGREIIDFVSRETSPWSSWASSSASIHPCNSSKPSLLIPSMFANVASMDLSTMIESKFVLSQFMLSGSNKLSICRMNKLKV
mmetsp:Transcript_37237/g.54842  ORF Transcript_37237/g.54842 Transcript_37237/m.54842 type:complete len:235 (-) Transcript_37237:10-714(-)